MTTFQDPPPQSRRAVRQSERETTELKPPFSTTGPLPTPPQSYQAPAESGDIWDTTQRRAAQIPPASPPQDASTPASGRRSSQFASPEPLVYSTQGRAQQAPPAAPTFRPRGGAAGQPTEAQQQPAQPQVSQPQAYSQPAYGQQTYDQPPTQAMPHVEQPAYRVRDYSPEGRRSAAPAPSAPAAAPQVPYSAPEQEWTHTSPPTDLDYQTQGRLPYEVPVAPVVAEPVHLAPVVHELPVVRELPVEQTLSRRELRALKLAEEGEAAPVAEAPAATPPATFAAAPPLPDINTGLTSAITEFDALTREPAVAHDPAPSHDPAPRASSAGHWAAQAEIDEHDLFESTLSRTVGSGAATTSALVLPITPGGTDIRGPLTGTGEIILTGSINLPRSLSSTGATARFDHGGIDALFDAGDAEVISTDSAPVSAIKAVSTHNSGFAVTHTQKPKGTRALTILLIAASSMAVVVAGLLVTAFALNVF